MRHSRTRFAFSLIELIVVMAITVLLVGLLFPALSAVKESTHRIICSSNQRQFGMGLAMYFRDHNDRLPTSTHASQAGEKPELMKSRMTDEELEKRIAAEPSREFNMETNTVWEGLGLLYSQRYCGSSGCFYCPSHTGDHSYDRYHGLWEIEDGSEIFTNYHYAGDIQWDHPTAAQRTTKRQLRDGVRMILATDGLRTKSDFNHKNGLNILRGDLSVIWWEDTLNVVVNQLPLRPCADTLSDTDSEDLYIRVWTIIKDESY